MRTPEEFERGTLPKALNIYIHDAFFTEKMQLYTKDTSIVIFCQSGRRSKEAYRHLIVLGFPKIKEIEGGLDAYKATN